VRASNEVEVVRTERITEMSESQIFLFRVMANNQGMYAVRVKAPDLQTAKDCLGKFLWFSRLNTLRKLKCLTLCWRN
jgi:hypothetical protein